MTENKAEGPDTFVTRVTEGTEYKRGTEVFPAPAAQLAPAGEAPAFPTVLLDQGSTPAAAPAQPASGDTGE